jgi:hypothetical protein
MVIHASMRVPLRVVEREPFLVGQLGRVLVAA